MTTTQALNQVIKWSFAISGITLIAIVTGVFSLWLLIEMLSVLVGVSA